MPAACDHCRVRSITKRRLTPDEVRAVFLDAFGPAAGVREIHEYTDGWFAAVYGVSLADGRDMVLKVSPPRELKLLRYEADLAHAEIEFYRRAAEAGIPVPAVRHADADRGHLIVDRLRGRSLEQLKSEMTDEQQRTIRRELGAMCARLNAVTGPLFGYPRRDGRTRSTSWRTSFLAIIDDILADAVEHRRDLPVPAEAIGASIRRHADVLDEVTTPALVHFDLWDGNVFVQCTGDAGGAGYAIEGIIDGERAFYGDPIAELVSLAVHQDPQAVPGLLEGYFGEERPMTASERLRWLLYSIYLDLILVTEGAVRGYDDLPEYADAAASFRRILVEHLSLL